MFGSAGKCIVCVVCVCLCRVCVILRVLRVDIIFICCYAVVDADGQVFVEFAQCQLFFQISQARRGDVFKTTLMYHFARRFFPSFYKFLRC